MANAKTRDGRQNRDRDAQFQHMNEVIERFRRGGQPAICVDTKKGLVDDFKDAGRELGRIGLPEHRGFLAITTRKTGRTTTVRLSDHRERGGY